MITSYTYDKCKANKRIFAYISEETEAPISFIFILKAFIF